MTEEEIRKTIIEAAYKFELVLRPKTPMDRMVLVSEQIASNEIVFTVWNDDAAPLGHNLMAIKGQQRLRELTDDNATPFLKIAAIKCMNAEQAEALLYFEGEPDHQH
jgi:hypothetical protein